MKEAVRYAPILAGCIDGLCHSEGIETHLKEITVGTYFIGGTIAGFRQSLLEGKGILSATLSEATYRGFVHAGLTSLIGETAGRGIGYLGDIK